MTARYMQPLFSAGLWRTATARLQCTASSCRHLISAASQDLSLSKLAEPQTSEMCPAPPCAPKVCSFAGAALSDAPLAFNDARQVGHDGIPTGQSAGSPRHSLQMQQWPESSLLFGVVIRQGSATHPNRGLSLGLLAQEGAVSGRTRQKLESVIISGMATEGGLEDSHDWCASSPHHSPHIKQPIDACRSLGWGVHPTGNAAGAMRTSFQRQGLASTAATPTSLGFSSGGSYGTAVGAAMGSQQVRGMAGGGGAWAKGHRSKMAMLRNKDGGDTGPTMRVNHDITAPEVRLVYEDNTHQVGFSRTLVTIPIFTSKFPQILMPSSDIGTVWVGGHYSRYRTMRWEIHPI